MCPNYWVVVYTCTTESISDVHTKSKQSLNILWKSLCSLYKSCKLVTFTSTSVWHLNPCGSLSSNDLQYCSGVSLWCCSMNLCSWSYATNNHSWLTPLEVWKSEREWAESVQYPSSEWSRSVEGSQSQCRVLLVSQQWDRVTDRKREVVI